MELRWEGVPSLATALRMLKEQAARTPPPQWARVIGGWTEFQFAERRMPTLDEISAAAPNTPVLVSHLYDRVFLNRAALRVVGYTKDTPEPPGGEIQRDRHGNPTGLLIARPNAWILYSTIFKAPKLERADQLNSTGQMMRELNRFGITSAIDAGGDGRWPLRPPPEMRNRNFHAKRWRQVFNVLRTRAGPRNGPTVTLSIQVRIEGHQTRPWARNLRTRASWSWAQSRPRSSARSRR